MNDHDTRVCGTCAVHEIQHQQIEQWRRQDFADNPNRQPDGCATIVFGWVAAVTFAVLMWAVIIGVAVAVT